MTKRQKLKEERLKEKDQFDKLNEKGKYKLPKKYKSYRDRAYKKEIEFDLSEEQFDQLLDNQCVYCGDAARVVDRIDSKKGYVLSNCQPCCIKCNMMKYTYSNEQFVNHIKKIHNFLFNTGDLAERPFKLVT